MNGMLRFALGLANMPTATVDDLDKSLPGFARLASSAKQLEPIIKNAMPDIDALEPLILKAIPHLTALAPLIQQAEPIIRAAYPDIVAVIPTVQELLAFAKGKTPGA
jgi:hypothetical protein